MSLDLVQVAVAVLVTAIVLAAYMLGKSVGADQERARAARTRRNLDRSRRAT